MSIWTDLEADVSETGVFLEGAFVGLFKAEVVVAKAEAEQVLPTLNTDIETAAATGNLSSLGPVLGTLFAKTATQLESQAIITGIQSLGTTVTAVLASHPAVAAMTPAPAQGT